MVELIITMYICAVTYCLVVMCSDSLVRTVAQTGDLTAVIIVLCVVALFAIFWPFVLLARIIRLV